MVGEVYNKDHDPQERTDVQRSWCPVADPAIRQPMPRPQTARPQQKNLFDNANSLCLGEGDRLALYRNSDVPANYRRVR